MVRVNLLLASTMEDGGLREHARTYVFTTDDGEEKEQGTIRDNKRGFSIEDAILAGSPNCVKGEPPKDAKPIARVCLYVVNARGGKATHRVTIERIAFEGKYFDAWRRMQRTAQDLHGILLKAAKARDEELAAKEQKK